MKRARALAGGERARGDRQRRGGAERARRRDAARALERLDDRVGTLERLLEVAPRCATRRVAGGLAFHEEGRDVVGDGSVDARGTQRGRGRLADGAGGGRFAVG
jgi:hypothetical protein